MSFIDNAGKAFEKFLFEQVPEESKVNEEGGEREIAVAQENVQNYDEISGTAAEEILNNALKSLEGREITVYTLKDLISTLPTGVKKEAILGVLAVTKVSVEDIQKDGHERIEILNSIVLNLRQKLNMLKIKLKKIVRKKQMQSHYCGNFSL